MIEGELTKEQVQGLARDSLDQLRHIQKVLAEEHGVPSDSWLISTLRAQMCATDKP